MKEALSQDRREELKRIARVDVTVSAAALEQARMRLGTAALTRLVRLEIGELRQHVLAGGDAGSLDSLIEAVKRRVGAVLATRARRVINATGVVLHTNLGRAPMSEQVAAEMASTCAGYLSVEIDLSTGLFLPGKFFSNYEHDTLGGEFNSPAFGGRLLGSVRF